MISFWKIAKIRRLYDSEPNVTHCAKEWHVDPKSVRKYVDKDVAPATKKPREQPTRTAPLDEFWPEIKTLLENDPKLKPYAILEFFVDKYPTNFEHSWRRTLERRIGQWKLEQQIEKNVVCSQTHQAGDVLAYDFTELASLNITVASQPWRGLLFHATLTQSNWEYGELPGIKCYLKLLHLAKHHGQDCVEIELRQALESAATIDPKSIESKIDKTSPASLVEDPHVEQPELDTYDDLLEHKEVLDEHDDELSDNRATELATEPRGTGWPFETTEIADDAIVGDQPCRSSGAGALEPPAVLERVDDSRNGPSYRESHFEALEKIGSRTQQDMVTDQVVSLPDGGATSHATAPERRVCEAGRELIDVRPTGFGENVATQCVGRTIDSAGLYGTFRSVCATRSTSVACQTGPSSTEFSIETWSILDVDHRRHRLCTTESRRDGSLVHVDCRSLRTDEYPDQQQPTIFKMGSDFQGPDDDSGSDRSASSSQYDHRAQRGKLPPRRSSSQTEGPSSLGITNTTSDRAKILPKPVGKFTCR